MCVCETNSKFKYPQKRKTYSIMKFLPIKKSHFKLEI